MAATDPFVNYGGGPSAPAAGAEDMQCPLTRAITVVTSNSTDLQFVTRAVWVGGAGDLKVTLKDGDTVTLSAVVAGSLLPIRVSRIWSDSTASLIVALW